MTCHRFCPAFDYVEQNWIGRALFEEFSQGLSRFPVGLPILRTLGHHIDRKPSLCINGCAPKGREGQFGIRERILNKLNEAALLRPNAVFAATATPKFALISTASPNSRMQENKTKSFVCVTLTGSTVLRCRSLEIDH